jgi:hypothetical protein
LAGKNRKHHHPDRRCPRSDDQHEKTLQDNFSDYASCITPLVVSSAYGLLENFPDFHYVAVEPTVMSTGALPVGCGTLVTSHEEDGSHGFEFTSLVGMRTSHVCALRTQDLYAPDASGSHLCHTVSSGQHNLRALKHRETFILHCHSFYSVTYRHFKRLNYLTSPR